MLFFGQYDRQMGMLGVDRCSIEQDVVSHSCPIWGNDMAKTADKKNKGRKVPFYEKRGTDVFCKIAGVLAGLMILASPFFHWKCVWVKVDIRVHEGFSLFDMVKYVFRIENMQTANMKLLMVFLLFLICLTGVSVLYFALRDQINPARFQNSDFVANRLVRRFRLIGHLVPLAPAIISLIIFKKQDVFLVYTNRLEDTYYSWQTMAEASGHDWKLPGAGWLCFFGGMALYLVAEGLRYLVNTLTEDD